MFQFCKPDYRHLRMLAIQRHHYRAYERHRREAERTAALFTREQFMALPLKLRQRWWAETSYGASLPSTELRAAIIVAISEAP